MISREPVLTAFLAFVAALVGLLVAFDVDVSSEQRAAIEGIVAAGAVLFFAVRGRVTPRG